MPHPLPSWPRRLRRLCVFLLLGLGTTVGVAWICVFVPRAEELQDTRHDRRQWLLQPPPDWPQGPENSSQLHGLLWDDVSVSHGSLFSNNPNYIQRSTRYGLPLRALEHRAASVSGNELKLTTMNTGITVGGDGPWGAARKIPLLPIWPGLAFNTLFYALLWWLALASVRMVKHNRRYRHGLCPLCRYDLRADYSQGCSECGWGRA